MNQHLASLDRLVVVGGGRMGEAIVGGLIAAGSIESERVVVVEPNAQRRGDLASAYGVIAVPLAAEAFPAAATILAVKPQVIDAVAGEIRDLLHNTLVISIAAGISTARLESVLPAGTPVVRVMPNTPALVGAAMSIISGGTEASSDHVDLVAELFGAIGTALVLDERSQDAAGAISGAGPAYFALVIDALARAGVRQGLSRDVAQTLAIQTMRGTAALLTETGQHPEALIDAVCSPGGTTIAGVSALERGGLRTAFDDAIAAAVVRARELGA